VPAATHPVTVKSFASFGATLSSAFGAGYCCAPTVAADTSTKIPKLRYFISNLLIGRWVHSSRHI